MTSQFSHNSDYCFDCHVLICNVCGVPIDTNVPPPPSRHKAFLAQTLDRLGTFKLYEELQKFHVQRSSMPYVNFVNVFTREECQQMLTWSRGATGQVIGIDLGITMIGLGSGRNSSPVPPLELPLIGNIDDIVSIT